MFLKCITNYLQSSFARYMSKQGFDTWILEVRGAGLSTRADSSDIKELGIAISEQLSAVEERVETTNDESPEVSKLTETFTGLAERLSGHLSEGHSRLLLLNIMKCQNF